MSRGYIRNLLSFYEEKQERKEQRTEVRELAYVWSLPRSEFLGNYKVSPEMVEYLCEELEDLLAPRTSEGLPVYLKVLTALRILINGHYQRGNGQDQTTAIAPTTVSKYLTQFLSAVNTKLKPSWIVFPGSEEARQLVALGFEQKFGLPNILGAIDCTHVTLFPPPGVEKVQFKNRHQDMSINVQLMEEPKQKRQYYTWTQETLKKALNALRTKTMGFNECARTFKIPKPTLRRHYLKLNKYSNITNIHKGRPTVFPDHIEKEFVKHLLFMESNLFGLTITDIRKLAFEIAEKNDIQHNFNKTKEMAGKAWFYKFIKRHKNLSVRQPESTSINRAKGFNKENVYDFFDKLEEIIDEKKITANTIFNVDETGVSTVQKKPQKIVGQKGKKQVGAIASGERGVNTTAVCAVSAAGQYIPPMLIFKRKRMCPELETGAPPGSKVTISDTGYINSDLFVTWLKHFIEIVKPSQEKNVLLLLDGHTTHSRNLAAIQLARDNGIIMLQLPGHSTHRLQPMDVAVFGPLNTYYIQAVESWMRANSGHNVTQYKVARLFNEAYQKAATVGNAASGFKASGVWPSNRHVFQDCDFAPSEIFEKRSVTDNQSLSSDGNANSSSNARSTSKTVREDFNDAEEVSKVLIDDLNETCSNTGSDDATICISPSIMDDPVVSFHMSAAEEHNTVKPGIFWQPKTLSTMSLNFLNVNLSATDTDCNEEDLKQFPKSLSSPSKENDKILLTRNNKNPTAANSGEENNASSLYLKVPIHVLSPLPKNKFVSKRKSGLQKTKILTSSPYKNELEESIQKRETNERKKIERKEMNELKKNTKKVKPQSKPKEPKSKKGEKGKIKKTNKRVLKTEAVDSKKLKIVNYGASTSKTGVTKRGEGLTKKTKKHIKKVSKRYESSSDDTIEEIVLDDDSDDIAEEDIEDNYCSVCGGYYYDETGPKVDWARCVRCLKWHHITCSEIPDICPKCLN